MFVRGKKLWLTKIVIVFMMVSLLSGCDHVNTNYTPPERPHLYWKTIDVVVTDIYHSHSLNGRHYSATITVYSDEYDLQATITEHGSGIFNNISFWRAEVGETRTATLHSYVMDSTGEVISREIVDVD